MHTVIACRVAYLYRIIVMHLPLVPSAVIYGNVVVSILVQDKEGNACSPACAAVEGKLIVQCEVTVCLHFLKACQILYCSVIVEELVYIGGGV